MVSDIRISIDFFINQKTRKLQKSCGEKGVICLLKLWIHAAMTCPSGELKGMDEWDIEDVTRWDTDRQGEFAQALENIGFIERKDGVFWLHDWQECNPWVSGEENRSNKARFSQLANHMPEVHKLLKDNDIQEISKEDYQAIKEAKNPIAEAKQRFGIKERKKQPEQQGTVVPTPYSTTVPTTVVRGKTTPLPNLAFPFQKENKESCAELSCDSSTQEEKAFDGFIDMPLNTGKAYWITHADIEVLQDLYQAIDVKQELKSIKAWLLANPKRRKTNTGINRFINAWLKRAHDKAIPGYLAKEQSEPERRRMPRN